MRAYFRLGPATLVTAAFIGPGTVVTASLAGANYGYALLWALLFSVIATMILQEMASRLGIVTG
ncbi:MAG: divalent metal cation transporter, partial [Alishewanella sp.]|nr:divalent metal cation transporter [Alishewanella sp.]